MVPWWPVPEGKRGLNLDADLIGPHLGPVMGTVHDETPGVHRAQSGEAFRHPVGRGDRLDDERFRRRVVVRRRSQQRAQAGFVRRLAEMDRQLPAPVVAFEGGAGGVVWIEAFAKKRHQPARGGFIANETGDGGGSGHDGRMTTAGEWPVNRYLAIDPTKPAPPVASNKEK